LTEIAGLSAKRSNAAPARIAAAAEAVVLSPRR